MALRQLDPNAVEDELAPFKPQAFCEEFPCEDACVRLGIATGGGLSALVRARENGRLAELTSQAAGLVAEPVSPFSAPVHRIRGVAWRTDWGNWQCGSSLIHRRLVVWRAKTRPVHPQRPRDVEAATSHPSEICRTLRCCG